MGALSRVQTQVRETLAEYDLLVFAGADVLRMSVMSETEPLPEGMPFIQLGLDDWEMGKNYPAEMAVRADLKETLAALIPALERLGGDAHAKTAKARIAALAETNWTAKRAAKVEQTRTLAEQTPITTDWLALQTAEALPANGVFVNEGLTNAFGLLEVLPFRDRYGFHALASGGIGWALPAAIGIQLAHPERPVLALIGDGSAMYSIQALWTAAHLKLPITYVIANNRGYRIIKQRLKAFHGNEHYVGMDFEDPEIDFVQLARSMGVTAERIEDPQALRPALDKALASGGPVLLDVVVERGV
jgi:benzoylformate decarboxylase